MSTTLHSAPGSAGSTEYSIPHSIPPVYAADAVPCPVGYTEQFITRSPFPFHIYLIGFMGTGKTTVAKFLSVLYGMELIEMDQVIEQREGMSVTDIFRSFGEEYYREAETRLLIDIQGRSNAVVSCGGGVPLREANVREMKKSGRVVLLTAQPKTVLERVMDSHDRPLIENNKTEGFIASLMEKRREKYEAAADIVVPTDGKTVAEVVEEIIRKLLYTDA